MYSQRIKLDILNHNGPDLFARAGEGSVRTIYAVIMSGDESITINNPVICARIVKPDKTFVYTTATVTSEAGEPTEIRFNIPGAASQVSGIGCYDIRIQENGESNIVYTAEGRFLVDDDMITEEMLESVAEVNGLIFPDDFYTKDDNVAIIDDNVTSTEKTWSSSKIAYEIASPDYTNTATGNPIELTDAADAPVVRLETEIQGSQDLHGYDKPWVGGAGKNKANIAENTTLPMSTSTYRIYHQEDDITQGQCVIISFFFKNAVYSSNSGAIANIRSKDGTNHYYTPPQFGMTANTPLTGIYSIVAQSAPNFNDILVYLGASYAQFSAGEVSVMLQIGSATQVPTTYEPYSNICPITAYTEGEIEVSDGDGTSTTHTTTYPSAIYRGSEDVMNGEVREERVVADMSTLNWTYDSVNNFFYTFINVRKPGANFISSQYNNIGEKSDAEMSSVDDGSIASNRGGKYVLVKDLRFNNATDFTNAMVGVQIAYELENPTTSSVTPTNLPIRTHSGYTKIESGTGDMEVEYIKSSAQSLVNLIEAVTR